MRKKGNREKNYKGELGDMPQKIVCEECGFSLYEGAEVKQPIEIILQYDGKCPKCGKDLEYNVSNIQVNLIDKEREVPSHPRSRI